jgi:hypothetical protein
MNSLPRNPQIKSTSHLAQSTFHRSRMHTTARKHKYTKSQTYTPSLTNIQSRAHKCMTQEHRETGEISDCGSCFAASPHLIGDCISDFSHIAFPFRSVHRPGSGGALSERGGRGIAEKSTSMQSSYIFGHKLEKNFFFFCIRDFLLLHKNFPTVLDP